MKTPGRIRDRLSPLEYTQMLCETHVKSEKAFSEELVKELARELQAYVPGLPFDIVNRYISLQDPTLRKEEKQKLIQRKK